MKINTNTLVSLGSAILASRVSRGISGVHADDVWGLVGLTRRRNHGLENAGWVALGALVGAGAALLLAPTSGKVARRLVTSEFNKAKDATTGALNELHEQGAAVLSEVEGAIGQTLHRNTAHASTAYKA